jgi:hypothetical protein
MAQTRLREGHGIPDSSRVPLGSLPASLQAAKAGETREGTVWLGL